MRFFQMGNGFGLFCYGEAAFPSLGPIEIEHYFTNRN